MTEHEQRMAEINERGLVVRDGEYVCLNPYDGNPLEPVSSWYDIPSAELRLGTDSFSLWLNHLREKRWFTSQMEADFLYVIGVWVGGIR